MNNKPFIERPDALPGVPAVPPYAPSGANNILLIATLTDSQLNALLEIINRQDHTIYH